MNSRFRSSTCRCERLTWTRSRGFYGDLLGLKVCGEKPGEFLQCAVGDAALCIDLEDGEEPTAAIFAVTGLDDLCARLTAAGVAVDRHTAKGRWDCAIVRDPDGHEIVFEATGS